MNWSEFGLVGLLFMVFSILGLSFMNLVTPEKLVYFGLTCPIFAIIFVMMVIDGK